MEVYKLVINFNFIKLNICERQRNFHLLAFIHHPDTHLCFLRWKAQL